MAKLTIYLPDDLAEAVRASDISPSPICQGALARVVKKMETMKETRSDIDRVAARLAATRNEGADRETAAGHILGATWAREHADLRDLEELADLDQGYWVSINLDGFPSLESYLASLGDDYEWLSHVKQLERGPFTLGFVRGALEVLVAALAHM